MTESTFKDGDIEQIRKRGMTLKEVSAQIEIFKKGFPHMKLQRPCIIGDGITVLSQKKLSQLERIFSEAVLLGRATKFVPASGAASRMFKSLLLMNDRYDRIDVKEISADKDDPDHAVFLQFVKGLTKFAFYDDLKSIMSQDGLDIEALLSKGEYKAILEYVLTAKGLNLAHTPKGLIKFHAYSGTSRTAFEEHLVEAMEYAMDKNRVVRIHFTVSPEHEALVKDHLKEVQGPYEKSGIRFDLSFSTQKPSTDTIAVDMENRPFRDRTGKLVFRPGGHGALLENLSDLKGDLVFIKNIDNVVPDRIRDIGNAMGLDLKDDLSSEELGVITADAVRKLNKEIGLPSFSGLSFGEEDLPIIAEDAPRDGCWFLIPKQTGAEEVLKLVKKEFSL